MRALPGGQTDCAHRTVLFVRRTEQRLQKSKEVHAKKRAVRSSSGNIDIEYSMHDLSGFKVDHVEEGLVENMQTVLTLKDTNFLMDVDDKRRS